MCSDCEAPLLGWADGSTSLDDRQGAAPPATGTKSSPRRRASANGDRNNALDGLRGIAIALVVIHHVTAFLWSGTFGHWLPGGFLGVDLFFVLSGYLITTLLLERRERGERGLGRFYQRRILRLLPAVLLMLVVIVTYQAITAPGAGSAPYTIIVTLANLGNWFSATTRFMAPVGIVWSLAVEEQFYLLWPITLFLLLRAGKSRRWILGAVTVAIVAIVVHRAQMWHSDPTWYRIYPRTDARLDALLIGAGLALAAPFARLHQIPIRVVSVAATTTFIGYLAATQLLRWDAGALYLGGFTVVALGAAILVAAVVDGRWAGCRLLAWRPLAGLGRVSYGVYLWHYPVFMLVSQHTPINTALRLSLGFGITAAMVSLSWFVVERPALAWKRRLDTARHSNRVALPTTREVSTAKT